MPYVVTINEKEYPVAFDKDGSVRLADSSFIVQVSQIDRRTFSVLLNGRSHKVIATKSGEAYQAVIDGVQEDIIVESDRTRLLKKYDTRSGSSRKRFEVHAPMPALVVKIEVAVGDEVTEGQGLIILEAMKMENEIRAHQPGKVKEIHVTKGTAVEKGELLMLLE